jgi:hypothetical protein
MVGACSHSSGSGDSAAGDQLMPAVNGGAMPLPNKAAVNGYGREQRSAAGVAVAGRHGSPVEASIPLLDDGYKIRTARMTVAVQGARNVSAKATQAGDIAVGAGGEIDADDRTTGPQATASLVLRVPPETLENTLTALSKLGIEQSRSVSTTDVTQKVADVNSRVASAQRSIARLRVLFDHASKIGDIIQLESELNQRESDLESLQAQQRALGRETSMATITLSLITAPKRTAPPKQAHHDNNRTGFVGGLKRGWDGFTRAASWVAQAVGTLLPFLVLLLLIGLGLRLIWPRLAHRTRPAPAPVPSD